MQERTIGTSVANVGRYAKRKVACIAGSALLAVAAAGCSGGASEDSSNTGDSVFEPDSARAFEVNIENGAVTELPSGLGYQTQNWTGNADENPNTLSGTSGAEELRIFADRGHVVQGFSGRVAGSSFTRIRIKEVLVRADGTLNEGGGFFTQWTRSAGDDGSNTPENQLVVSNPELVTGVGLTITNQNLFNVVLGHRTYDPSTGCLVGVENRNGVNSTSAERYWSTQFLQNVVEDVKLRTVVVGVGARERNDNVESITIYTKTLLRQTSALCR